MTTRRQTIGIISAGILLIALLALSPLGWQGTWRLWNVPAAPQSFWDLRTLTAGAEAQAAGEDPFVNNPRDPDGRPLNYPRIWKLWLALDVGQNDTAWLGGLVAAAFVAGVFLFVGLFEEMPGWFFAAGLFSPAVLLGVERGNVDLLVFLLSSCALALLPRSTWAAAGCVLAGFLLKLFPIFGAAVFLRENFRRFAWIAGMGAAGAALYGWLIWDDLLRIRATTPQAYFFSYGAECFSYQFAPVAPRLAAVLLWLGPLAAAAWLGGVWITGFRAEGRPPPRESRALDAFRLGSGIYLGTFFLGTNFDYRLMFTLFCVPQLGQLIKQPGAAWPRLTTGCLGLSLWGLFPARLALAVPHGATVFYFADQLWKWGLFLGLGYLFVRSLPPWLAHPGRDGAGKQKVPVVSGEFSA